MVTCKYANGIRKIDICIGEVYIVSPLNPLKKKYIDEKVRLIKHEPFGDGTFVLRLDSEWHMKRNAYTKIDICDLIHSN